MIQRSIKRLFDFSHASKHSAAKAKGEEGTLAGLAKRIDELEAKVSKIADLAGSCDTEVKERLNNILYSESKVESEVPGDFYLEFENRYRGSEASIIEKQRPYGAIVSSSFKLPKRATIIDIGCGRGEWLELLATFGYKSTIGIDLNISMVEHCKAKGLNVVMSTAHDYIAQLDPGSVDLITGFHIVEHLSIESLLELMKLCFQALKPGGRVVFETPNPRNIIVGAYSFHFDPTHNKPLPPELLSYIGEYVGFQLKDVLEKNQSQDLLNAAKEFGDNMRLFRNCLTAGLDYGIIFRRPPK